MTNDQNQEFGFGIEATPETDPINSASAAYWLFGVKTFKNKAVHPIERHDWQPVYKGDKRNPAGSELVSSSVTNGLVFFPVNLIPYYLILGNSVTAAGIHTITNINEGSLPTITVRSESTGGTVDKIFSAVGCKVNVLSGFLDFTGEYNTPMSMSLGYNGIKNVTPSYNAVHNGAQFPTTSGAMGGTQVSTRFKRDTNFAFHWDSGGDNINYSNEVAIFEWTIQNFQNLVNVQNQSEIEYIDEGRYIFSFSIALWRGADRSIYDDYLAKTLHNMYMTIYAGSTNYVTHTWNNAALTLCEAPVAEGGEKKLWNITGWTRDFTITGKDGLPAATYYGE